MEPSTSASQEQGRDSEALNRNQKKKLRQKRSRMFKRTAERAIDASVAAPASKRTCDHRDEVPANAVPAVDIGVEHGDTRFPLQQSTVEPLHPPKVQPSFSSVACVTGSFLQAQADLQLVIAHRNLPSPGSDALHCVSLTETLVRATDERLLAAPSNHTVVLPGTLTESAASVVEIRQNEEPAMNSGERESNQADEGPAIPNVSHRIAVPPLEEVAPRAGPNGQRVYIFGNYHRYYGYRLGQAFVEDPRLTLLERSWFAGKRCMDIGCNEGLITLALATRYGTRSMVGVDIDEHLIRRACSHLREERTAAMLRSHLARQGGTSASERRAAKTALAALAQTWFVHGDFIESRAENNSLDCITALSISKWIHLHRGDAGLRAFFAKVYSLLAPGGYFVLEPQPWKSYRAAAAKLRRNGGPELPLPTGTYLHRLDELQLKPETFTDLLSDEIGFTVMRQLQPPEETAAGFDRPMLLLRKLV